MRAVAMADAPVMFWVDADGWWPLGIYSPQEYADKLQVIRSAADQAGRDPHGIVPALIHICLIGDDAELADILSAPLLKAFILQIPAAVLKARGLKHPLGDTWRGVQDINPGVLTRERIVDLLAQVRPEMVLAAVPHGSVAQVAKVFKDYADAGMRVPKILDYSGMAGLKYAARSAVKVREVEDALLRLVGKGA